MSPLFLRMMSRADFRSVPKDLAVVGGVEIGLGIQFNYVAQASPPAGCCGVSPPVSDSRTGTVLELVAEDGCAT